MKKLFTLLLFLFIFHSILISQITLNQIKEFLINENHPWVFTQTDFQYDTPPPPTLLYFLEKKEVLVFFVENDHFLQHYYKFYFEKSGDTTCNIIIENAYDIILEIDTKQYYLICDFGKPKEMILRRKGNSPEEPMVDFYFINKYYRDDD